MNRQYTRALSWIALAGAAAIVPAHAGATTAHASNVDLGVLMTRALDGAHSFKVVSDSSTTHASASPGGMMKMHIEEIFIRRGTGFSMSMQMTLNGRTTAEVFTGTHLCLKKTAAAAWDCSASPAYARAFVDGLDPVKAFKASGVVMASVSSAGSQTVQGQSCTGYRYALSLQSLHLTGHGTMWFSAASGRIVQVDGVSTMALVAGRPAMVVTSTGSYSRWNDPSLSIPAVPAS